MPRQTPWPASRHPDVSVLNLMPCRQWPACAGRAAKAEPGADAGFYAAPASAWPFRFNRKDRESRAESPGWSGTQVVRAVHWLSN